MRTHYHNEDLRQQFQTSSIAGNPPDLLITDVVMPKMSGRELVESLRAMKGDLKFMYTSGYTNDTIVQHDILRSGTVLVEKPIDSEILLGRIREVLDSGKK